MKNKAQELKELDLKDLDPDRRQIVRMVYVNNHSEYVVISSKLEHGAFIRSLTTLGDSKLDEESTDFLRMKDEKTKMYPLTEADEEIVNILLQKAEDVLDRERLKHIAAIEEIGERRYKFRTLQKVEIK